MVRVREVLGKVIRCINLSDFVLAFFVGLFKENHTDVLAKIIVDRIFESSFARSDRCEGRFLLANATLRRENRTKGKWDSLVERKDGFISRTLKSDLARDRRFEPWVEERYRERASGGIVSGS